MACWTSARSSGWVTPTQGVLAVRTREARGRRRSSHQGGHDLGEQHLGALVAGVRQRGLEVWAQPGGEAPQVHRDQRVGGQLFGGAAVPGAEAARPVGCDQPPLVDAGQVAVGGDVADPARHRRVADRGQRQREADQARLARLGHEVRRQQPERPGPVEVVGVGDAVGGVGGELAPGRGNGVHRPARPRLLGEADGERLGPHPVHVVADVGARARAQHQDDRREPGFDGVAGHEVDDRLAARADRRQRLAAAVAAGLAGRQDDQTPVPKWLAHPPQRRTALAQVIPPPNPLSKSRSPALTRPVCSASSRARGMEADDVLP